MLAALKHTARRAADRLIPPSVLVRRGPGGARRLAITFDDGPCDLTRAYLDVLDAACAYATFFLMGDLTSDRPDDALEIVRRGHEVGGHGFGHLAFPTLTRAQLLQELADTAAALPPMGGPRPLVRPPYGAVTPSVLATLARAGYTTALWSVDSLDHTERDTDALCATVAPDRVTAGDIVLFHEGQPWTLAALPRILGALRDAGYDLVTVSELIA